MMKTLTDIRKHLDSLESTFGFNPNTITQDDPEWMIMKLGVISATGAEAILAKSTTEKRRNYLANKAGEVCTGQRAEVRAKQMEWGLDNEGPARSLYQFFTENKIEQLPIVYENPTLRAACSPDGLGEIKGAEIKCPYTTEAYIRVVTDSKIKPEYEKQCQFSMWVTGRELWDFINYDKRMNKKPFHVIPIERDEKMMKLFDDAVPQAIHEIDEILKKIGIKFGDHWKLIREKKGE